MFAVKQECRRSPEQAGTNQSRGVHSGPVAVLTANSLKHPTPFPTCLHQKANISNALASRGQATRRQAGNASQSLGKHFEYVEPKGPLWWHWPHGSCSPRVQPASHPWPGCTEGLKPQVSLRVHHTQRVRSVPQGQRRHPCPEAPGTGPEIPAHS